MNNVCHFEFSFWPGGRGALTNVSEKLNSVFFECRLKWDKMNSSGRKTGSLRTGKIFASEISKSHRFGLLTESSVHPEYRWRSKFNERFVYNGWTFSAHWWWSLEWRTWLATNPNSFSSKWRRLSLEFFRSMSTLWWIFSIVPICLMWRFLFYNFNHFQFYRFTKLDYLFQKRLNSWSLKFLMLRHFLLVKYIERKSGRSIKRVTDVWQLYSDLMIESRKNLT